MTYFRLLDIKTPPFAYVVNKEQAVHSCRACEMPFRELRQSLHVEIIARDAEEGLRGRPLFADHWLVGDDRLATAMETRFPGQLERVPITVTAPRGYRSDHLVDTAFFSLEPRHTIALAPEMKERFPPVRCHACRRMTPELPFDFQPIPTAAERTENIVALDDFFLEGYGYLFHERVVARLAELFPEMILEPVVSEPIPF